MGHQGGTSCLCLLLPLPTTQPGAPALQAESQSKHHVYFEHSNLQKQESDKIHGISHTHTHTHTRCTSRHYIQNGARRTGGGGSPGGCTDFRVQQLDRLSHCSARAHVSLFSTQQGQGSGVRGTWGGRQLGQRGPLPQFAQGTGAGKQKRGDQFRGEGSPLWREQSQKAGLGLPLSQLGGLGPLAHCGVGRCPHL